MSFIKTKILVDETNPDEFVLNTGNIPATLFIDDSNIDNKYLIISKTGSVNFYLKKIEFDVKVYKWLSELNMWLHLPRTTQFNSGKIIVTTDTFVDAYGIPLDPQPIIPEDDIATLNNETLDFLQNTPNEYSFWYDNMGYIIVDSIQNAMIRRFNI